MEFFIQIENHIDKTIKIVNKITNLDTYSSDFNIIINKLNTDNTFDSVYHDLKVELFKTETTVVKGYIYNSTKIIKTLVYTLTLIQYDNILSQLFKNNVDNTSQTDIQSQQEQTDTINTMMSNLNINETESKYDTKDGDKTDTEADSEFGEFQSAPLVTPDFSYKFTNTVPIDLTSYTHYNFDNSCYTYNSDNYYNSYNSYNPYNSDNSCNPYNIGNSYNPYIGNSYAFNQFTKGKDVKSNSYNPFDNINGLRDYNTDIYINKGSQQSTNPTNVEFINELKLRLTQPNSGLKYSVNHLSLI